SSAARDRQQSTFRKSDTVHIGFVAKRAGFTIRKERPLEQHFVSPAGQSDRTVGGEGDRFHDVFMSSQGSIWRQTADHFGHRIRTRRAQNAVAIGRKRRVGQYSARIKSSATGKRLRLVKRSFALASGDIPQH